MSSGKSGTDWNRLASMTEEEIYANALSDPDNPPLTDEQLAKAVCLDDIPGETLFEKLVSTKKCDITESEEDTFSADNDSMSPRP